MFSKDAKMAKVQMLLSALVILLVSAGICSAEIYMWKDEDGVTHFSDTEPEDVSEWDGENASGDTNDNQPNKEPQRIKYDVNVINEILNEITDEEEEEDTQQKHSVELYIRNFCPYCNKAKTFFNSRGIEITLYNVEVDEKAADRMKSLTKSSRVPFVVINGHRIQGYSAAAYKRALHK
jgi:glutaredoxin